MNLPLGVGGIKFYPCEYVRLSVRPTIGFRSIA